MPILLDFLKFVIFPKYQKRDISIVRNILNILQMLAFSYVLVLISMGIISLVDMIPGIPTLNDFSNKISEGATSNDLLFMFISAAVIAPLWEEVFFRIYLKYSLSRVLLGLLFTGYSLLTFLHGYFNNDWIDTIYRYTILERINIEGVAVPIWILLLLMLPYIYLVLRFTIDWILKRIYHFFFPLIVVASAIIFGSAHFFNYNAPKEVFIFFPLFTLPQIVIGLTLGYIRVKYNLLTSIVTHSWYNAMLMMLYFTSLINFDNLESSTLSYQLGVVLFLIIVLAIVLLFFIINIYTLIETIVYIIKYLGKRINPNVR